MKRRLGQGGFSLMEILVAIGVLSTSIYLVIGTLRTLMDQTQRSDRGATLQALRHSFTRTVLSPVAWQETITRNAGFACWNNVAQGCRGVAPITFSPFSSTGTLFRGYDPANNPSQGFRSDGTVCNSFSLTTPSLDCPVRVEFLARPLCPPPGTILPIPPCHRPPFEVSVNFIFAYPAGVAAPSASGLSHVIQVQGDSLPVRLTSRTQPTVCPIGELLVAMDPVSGDMTCALGAPRIYGTVTPMPGRPLSPGFFP